MDLNMILSLATRNYWTNKKANFLGDSITEGSCEVGINPRTLANPYPSLVKNILGLNTARNYGVGGTCIASRIGDSDQSMSVRYTSMDDDADLIVVFGGTNDFGVCDVALGTTADSGTSTFYGALNTLMTGLINKYPTGQIVFITPLHRAFSQDAFTETNTNTPAQTLSEFVDAIKDRAKYYGIPILDLYSMSGMQPAIEIIKTTYMTDGLHPIEAGHESMAEKLAGFLTTLGHI